MTIWGASAGFRSPNTGIEEWEAIDAEIRSLNGDYGMQARRSYHSSMPSSIDGTYMEQDLGERVSCFSIRPPVDGNAGYLKTIAGDYDSTVSSLCQSVTDEGHRAYLCYVHEPENNGGSPRNFRKAAARFNKVVLDHGDPNIVPVTNLMAYTWATSSRVPADWNPGRHMNDDEIAATVLALDGYGMHLPYQRTPSWLFTEPYNDIVGDWGFRFGIFETGVHDIVGRDTWMLALEDWVNARSANIDVVCWWHSVVTGNPSTWLDGDAGSSPYLDTWADIIARNQGASIPVVPAPDVEIPTPTTSGISVSPGVNIGQALASSTATSSNSSADVRFVGRRH